MWSCLLGSSLSWHACGRQARSSPLASSRGSRPRTLTSARPNEHMVHYQSRLVLRVERGAGFLACRFKRVVSTRLPLCGCDPFWLSSAQRPSSRRTSADSPPSIMLSCLDHSLIVSIYLSTVYAALLARLGRDRSKLTRSRLPLLAHPASDKTPLNQSSY